MCFTLIGIQCRTGNGIDTGLQQVIHILGSNLLTDARILHDRPVASYIKRIRKCIRIIIAVFAGNGGEQFHGFDTVGFIVGNCRADNIRHFLFKCHQHPPHRLLIIPVRQMTDALFYRRHLFVNQFLGRRKTGI